MSNTKSLEQTSTGWIGAALRHGYARVAAAIPGFSSPEPIARAEPSPEEIARAARRFALALREDSNLAIDWLWCAAQMIDDDKRRYCIERALAIDPHSELAKRALAVLPAPTASADMALFGRPADRSA